MKKNRIRVVISISVIILIIVFFVLHLNYPIWKANAKQFSKSLKSISKETSTIDNLSNLTTFEWDTLYSFAPYTPENIIYNAIGFRWEKINSTVSEGMNQIIFLKDNKVICYIDGYANKSNMLFNFDYLDSSYFKLTSSDKLAFNTILTDHGVRILDYKE